MYEIVLDLSTETGDCQCLAPGCKFCERVTGHAQILEMQADATMHAMTTGHLVEEHYGGTRFVRPRSSVEY